MLKVSRKDLVEDDRWKLKGHAHPRTRNEPRICLKCKGAGTITSRHFIEEICPICDGEGVLW
jgi:DnaJ-class molecular chaperone